MTVVGIRWVVGQPPTPPLLRGELNEIISKSLPFEKGGFSPLLEREVNEINSKLSPFLKGDRGGFKAQLRCKLMGNLENSEDRV